MLHKICGAGLDLVGENRGARIYRIDSIGKSNDYYIISSEGTRRLMACPEVVGFDSYLAMVPPTAAALEYIFKEEQDRNVSILTILRGGLNYPLEECAFKAGLRVGTINFLSCERIIRNNIITGLDVKYEKLHVEKNATLMIGDIIASGDTLKLCLQHVIDTFAANGGSIRRIVFFTIGGTKAIPLMEEFTKKIRTIWPSFEGFRTFFYEGVFTVYEDNGVTGVNIPDIDFGWNGGIISPDFRSHILDMDDAIFEKCIIYDGGARRYEIGEHCREVLEYWTSLREAAGKADMNAFVAEKTGYAQPTDYESWLELTGYKNLPVARVLYEKEQNFIRKAAARDLKAICEKRIEEFTKAMTDYII